MSRAEVILDQLRDAAAGKPYTEELIKELKKRNCHGFPGRPIEKTDQAMTIALNYVLSQRFKTGAFFFSELHELNIPYAVVKGVVLSQRIYGVAGARISGDVDIVLPRRYADTAKELLIRNGFCQGYLIRDRIVPYNRRSIIFQASQTHQLAPFICKTTNPLCPFINYDINTSLHWGRNRIDLYEFLSDPVDFSFGQISFRTLPKEKEFLALCLHHYKDWNSIFLISEYGIPLSHFFDIYGYLVIQRPDIQVLLNLSEKYKVAYIVYYCIKYTSELFEISCLDNYLKAFETNNNFRTIGITDSYGLDEDSKNKWTFSLAERLFDDSFKYKFEHTLDINELKSIQINRLMMKFSQQKNC